MREFRLILKRLRRDNYVWFVCVCVCVCMVCMSWCATFTQAPNFRLSQASDLRINAFLWFRAKILSYYQELNITRTYEASTISFLPLQLLICDKNTANATHTHPRSVPSLSIIFSTTDVAQNESESDGNIAELLAQHIIIRHALPASSSISDLQIRCWHINWILLKFCT